jgi:hypothetical protein
VDISLNKNVFQALQDATRDNLINQQDIKDLEKAVAADGTIDSNEKKLLEHLENYSNSYTSKEKVNISVKGSSDAVMKLDLITEGPKGLVCTPDTTSAVIKKNLVFSDLAVGDVTYDQKTESIQKLTKHSSENETISYGKNYKAVLGPHIEVFKNQADAIKSIRAMQTFSVDANDYAIQQTAKNRYVVRPIQTINASIADDIDQTEIEQVKLGKGLQDKIVAIVADSGDIKHFSPLPSWQPAESIKSTSQVLQRLNQMEKTLLERGDHRGVFPSVNKVTTERAQFIIQAIRDPQNPDHQKYKDLDADLIENIVIEFGKKYFEAFDAYEKGDMSKVPAAWKIAFDEAKTETTSIAEDMLLGINAHIGYDLAMLLSQKLPDGKPLYDSASEKQCNTFAAFNQILIDETPFIIVNARLAETKLGGVTAVGMDYAKILGEVFIGEKDVESITKNLIALARADAESSSTALAAGKITPKDVDKIIGDRSRLLTKIPNTGRNID